MVSLGLCIEGWKSEKSGTWEADGNHGCTVQWGAESGEVLQGSSGGLLMWVGSAADGSYNVWSPGTEKLASTGLSKRKSRAPGQ